MSKKVPNEMEGRPLSQGEMTARAQSIEDQWREFMRGMSWEQKDTLEDLLIMVVQAPGQVQGMFLFNILGLEEESNGSASKS